MSFEQPTSLEAKESQVPQELQPLFDTHELDEETFQALIKDKPLNGVQMLLMYYYPSWNESHAEHFRGKFLPYHPHILEGVAGGDLNRIVDAFHMVEELYHLDRGKA